MRRHRCSIGAVPQSSGCAERLRGRRHEFTGGYALVDQWPGHSGRCVSAAAALALLWHNVLGLQMVLLGSLLARARLCWSKIAPRALHRMDRCIAARKSGSSGPLDADDRLIMRLSP
jgi:hypothetical protein